MISRIVEARVHRGAGGLAELQPAWLALQAELPKARFFHTWAWHAAWLATLADAPEQVLFVACSDGGRCVAIVPLQRQADGRFGARRWGLPEHNHWPLADVIAAPGVAAAALLDAVCRALAEARIAWEVLGFEPVMAESVLAPATPDAAQGKAADRAGRGDPRLLASQVKTCDQIDCDIPWEPFAAALSGNFRSNLNKARKKLAQQEEEVRLEVARTPEALQRAFEPFLASEASGWKGTDGTAIVQSPALQAFYSRLLQEFGSEGRLRIHLLRLGSRVIAAQFCFIDSDTLYVHKLGYDESLASLSPGNSLLERVVRLDAAERGFRYINLEGSPPWFRNWNPAATPVYRLVLIRHSLRGWLLRAERLARVLRGRLRRPARSR